jgi:ribosomal-protein-serine acetyltransferase
MLVVPPRAELRHRPLDTERLLLSPVEPTDASDLWLAVDTSRAHLEKWLPWVPFNTDPDASWRYCDASAVDWDHTRALRFSIRERSTRRFLGVIGLESLAHLHQSADLGYWLRVDGVRRGYMTEAARTILAWAFGPLNVHRIRVAAATGNDASLGVIRRLGFQFEGVAREAERCQGRWLDHALFALLATDSVARAALSTARSGSA